MTSDIGALALGAPAGALPDGVFVGEKPDTCVVFGVWLGPPPPVVCEHPATSNDAAIIAAFRIQSG
ncbi:hypothetical protein MMAN_15020 [Mycobacterium mantenii]|uniref:Uncharacterized protein n=1 Tax=Mycobacterium mantenii TaxID=560555 RepID=A0ABN6A2I2_MYCNT|nr:hypothetical protein MMAN_15020 [Mycobacterium mantenii]